MNLFPVRSNSPANCKFYTHRKLGVSPVAVAGSKTIKAIAKYKIVLVPQVNFKSRLLVPVKNFKFVPDTQRNKRLVAAILTACIKSRKLNRIPVYLRNIIYNVSNPCRHIQIFNCIFKLAARVINKFAELQLPPENKGAKIIVKVPAGCCCY